MISIIILVIGAMLGYCQWAEVIVTVVVAITKVLGQ